MSGGLATLVIVGYFGGCWLLWWRGRKHRNAGRFAAPWQRRALWAEQRGRCYACHGPLRGTVTEAHHVKPWSQGGRTVLANLILLHEECHAAQTRLQARRYGWHQPGH